MAQIEVSQHLIEVATTVTSPEVQVSQVLIEVAYTVPRSRIQVSWAEFQVPESSFPIITLNEITLSGSAPQLTVAPGGITVAVDELTLASSVPAATVASTVSVAMNELTLVSSAEALLLIVDRLIALNEITLAGSAPQLTVAVGGITVVVDELTLVGSIPQLTVIPGLIAVALNEVTLAGSVPPLTVAVGGITVALNEVTLASSTEAVTVTVGGAVISLGEITLASSAVQLVVVEPEILRPDADDSIGSWTDELGGSTDIFTSIDEPFPPVDSDYIQSEQLPVTSVYRATLLDANDPFTSTSHYVSYRYKKDLASASALDLIVRLKQGASTVIASWTHLDIGTSFVTATQELSTSQADAITDYDDLRIEFEADTQ